MLKRLFAVAFILVTPLSAPAFSAPITYGCDTPADHFSAIEQKVGLKSFVIKGSIQPKEFRKGKYQPLAQIFLQSVDSKQRWAMQVMALEAKAKEAYVVLDMTEDGKDLEPLPIGTVKLGEKLAFDVRVADGKLSFRIGDMVGQPELSLGEQADLNIICSTGDFVFSDLEWSEK